ncbi:MAG: hypothetical protein ACTSU5_16965 [Promethearchaeota archaeon]
MKRLECLEEVEQLIESDLFSMTAVNAVTVGTHGGTMLSVKFRDNLEERDPKQLVAATTSMLFLASSLTHRIFNQEIKYSTSYGSKEILICTLTHNLAFSFLLNRELVELEGLSSVFMPKLNEFCLKISAIVETSDYVEKDIFVKIKRAIPNALAIAIITSSGMPIKVQSTMSEPKLSAIISALQNITVIIFGDSSTGSTEYSIITSEHGGFIIHRIDQKRLLGVAIPESDDAALGKTLARIKEIIKT